MTDLDRTQTPADDETRVVAETERVTDLGEGAVEETSVVAETERVTDLGDGTVDREGVRVERRRKRPTDPFAVAMLVIALLVGAAALAWWLTTRDDDTQAVPAVEGLQVEQAVATLESDGFASDLERGASESAPGLVVRQSPAAGEEAEEGSTVTLLVSSGPATEAVPNAVGLTETAARETIVAAGFEVTSNDVFSDREPGIVTEQKPVAGAELAPGGRVTLSVSRGPNEVAVPDVVGLTQSAAEQALTDAGLEPDVDEVPSTEPAGTVVAQHPTPGEEIPSGDAVRINVSLGPS